MSMLAPRVSVKKIINYLQVDVAWLKNNGGDPAASNVRYKLEHRQQGQPWLAGIGPSTARTFSNFVPVTWYDFRVTLINSFGVGVTSDITSYLLVGMFVWCLFRCNLFLFQHYPRPLITCSSTGLSSSVQL